jgi:hypothetical protein
MIPPGVGLFAPQRGCGNRDAIVHTFDSDRLRSPAEQVDIITTVVDALVPENGANAAPLSFGSALKYSR